jgi:hypothetical protein
MHQVLDAGAFDGASRRSTGHPLRVRRPRRAHSMLMVRGSRPAKGERAMTFWNIIWFIAITYALVAYLMLLFNIIADLFHDREVSGWAKAGWMIALIFLPFLTALVYLGVRGRDMSERQYQRAQEMRQAQYATSGVTSPTEEISKAKSMLDAGVLDRAEYDALKLKALA